MAHAHRQGTATAQLSAERSFMTSEAARQLMDNPVQLTRGHISSITLIVPVFENPDRRGRHAYLVAQIPQAMVNELLQHLGTLPEAQRGSFVRDYIQANQRSMISRYLDNRGARFRFDSVSASQVTSSARITPRRTAAPPRRASPPPTVRASPTPRRTAQPTERPVPRPAPRAQLPELPPQVRGGRGTRSSPYQIRLRQGRATRGTGSREVNFPLNLSVGLGGGDTSLRVYVTVSVTASQLANSRVSATSSELRNVVQGCLARRAAEERSRLESTSRRDALNQIAPTLRNIAQRAGRRDAEVRDYIQNN